MKTAYDFFHSKEQWGNTSDGYEDFSTSDMVRFAEEYATQAKGGSGEVCSLCAMEMQDNHPPVTPQDESTHSASVKSKTHIDKEEIDTTHSEVGEIEIMILREGIIELRDEKYQSEKNGMAKALLNILDLLTLTKPVEITEEWVKIDDKLPDEPVAGETIPVLATEGDGKPVFECAYEGKGEFCSSMFSHYIDAKYWMPLPEPPTKLNGER